MYTILNYQLYFSKAEEDKTELWLNCVGVAKFLNNSYWESKEKLVIYQFRGRYYRKAVKN